MLGIPPISSPVNEIRCGVRLAKLGNCPSSFDYFQNRSGGKYA